MKCTYSKSEVLSLILKQLDNLYPLLPVERDGIDVAFENAWNRAAYCYSFSAGKYYVYEGESTFDPFHGAQYAVFLYLLSNSLFKTRHPAASKIYLLNRTLHCVDLYHEIALPDIWRLDHPLGSVMGRAEYSDFLFFSHACTVGNIGGKYPKIGKLVWMSAGSYILGDSNIGDCCILAAGAMVKNETIPPFSLIFGQSPNIVVRQRDPAYFIKHYSEIWAKPDELVESVRNSHSSGHNLV